MGTRSSSPTPRGTDTIDYDALDRLTRVSRNEGGVVQLEQYAYNALGALSQNAGVALDHQRPRLDGAGKADAAVPASIAGQDVTLDRAGRVTTLRGADFAWSKSGILRSAAGVPLAFDNTGRRTWTDGNKELCLYSGPNRLAQLEQQQSVIPAGSHPGELSIQRVHELAVLEDLTREEDFGWIVFYSSKRFVETRNSRWRAGGNGPIMSTVTLVGFI